MDVCRDGGKESVCLGSLKHGGKEWMDEMDLNREDMQENSLDRL